MLSAAFYPFALAYLGLYWLDLWPVARHFAGAVATLLAWLTIFSTAMIYASLKTIRHWNTPLVPAAYLSLGHFSGGMILLAVAMLGGGNLAVRDAVTLSVVRRGVREGDLLLLDAASA